MTIILPVESYTAFGTLSNPSLPIQAAILAELSTKNKMLAASSPDPAPGGTGFEFEFVCKLTKTNITNNNFKILFILSICI